LVFKVLPAEEINPRKIFKLVFSLFPIKEKSGKVKNLKFLISALFVLVFFISFVSAYYVGNIYFTIPDSVFKTSERIEFTGYLYLANYSDNRTIISASAPVANAAINLTIYNSTVFVGNYTFTTDSTGKFYSKSSYYGSAREVNASSNPGKYKMRAEYIDPGNATWFSEVEIEVFNNSVDLLSVSSEKVKYNPLETVRVNVEAIRALGDNIFYIANVSVNGNVRNSSKASLQTFSCTTGSNGKCSTTVPAPTTYGSYILEVNNYKAFSSFIVAPFSANAYMKDELGKSMKNVFSVGEQGRVEVTILNASSTDVYTFYGYIADPTGSSIKAIDSTRLDSNNSFINSFLFSIDNQFSYGTYTTFLTIYKTGAGSITTSTSFEVKDWDLSVNKRTSNAGFEYEYSIFPNKTMYFEAYPTYRTNGSVIPGINSTFFSINLTDNLNNIIKTANMSWNSTCGTSGCYQFYMNSSSTTGKYFLAVSLAYGGDIQTKNQIIDVIGSVMSAQSTDKDGNIKELFGTNEYAYLSLTAYNFSSASFNLSDAEIFLVNYMNGTDFSYTQVANFSLVNLSNSAYEWAWNATSQRIKLDVPKAGGIFNVLLFGNNRSMGAETKFIVNPYDACLVPKTTPGTVTTGYYYVWQFKTTDTIYFEIKIYQANNPLGRATASNSTNGSAYGMGSACASDSTKQALTNATLSVQEVRNLESGAVQNLNTSESTCQASDNSGTYTCTVKPYSKWSGGGNIAKIAITGQDGTTSIAYGRFEARAFYMNGYSNIWQNNPSNNISLNIRIYEAGSNWWSTSGSSGGLSGTVTLKKIEYQGSDGEWLWPPISYNYNVSAVNSTSITSGSGTINLPASLAPSGRWKTGYYRVILQATTSTGDTDYGYAWFGIKLWDVYGAPIECTMNGCSYKNYFNSKENISLYVTISKAGSNYWSYSAGQDIGGNVTLGVKKIQDCRKWPCKELNSTEYVATRTTVNESSPWYWNANLNSTYNKNFIYINSTKGTWGTGYYSVTLDVNGTDTGNAWFNTLAFYVETQPTNPNGSGYKSGIRGHLPMYFNITTVKSYKSGYSWYNGSNWLYTRYNQSDYVNVTVDDVVLRAWDSVAYTSKEYNYPENINITPLSLNGSSVVNITYLNGTWPTGYYWGELSLKNSDNETSTGWLWFSVQPFRVDIQANSYEIDSDQCVNASLSIYDPDWYSTAPLWGNYSITSVYENIWSSGGMSITPYTNYTSGSFNATSNITVCPDSNSWGTGSWGGYHYLNVVVKDNALNDTQTGWLSFKATPFRISWSSSGGSRRTNENFNVTAMVIKPSSGANTTANLTKIYQWRYDNYMSTLEEYRFKVGSCDSAVSGKCTVNGTQNVTIYAPTGGWKVGYNYLYSQWASPTNSLTIVDDYYGIYFDGREAYNGYFENRDSGGYNWKHDFANDENLTIKLFTRDSDYNSADLTITSVQYAYSADSCGGEWCKSYTTADFWPKSTSGGSALLKIQVPSTNWTNGYYYIKASVEGGAGTIIGGEVRVKDMIGPNVTINAPVMNGSYSNSNLSFSATTSENAECSLGIYNFENYFNWMCWGWNSSNATALQKFVDSCNSSYYGFNGTSYYNMWISKDYYSSYDGMNSTWASGGSYLSTGLKSHTYVFNTTSWPAQHYGLYIWCHDNDWNYGSSMVTFKINNSVT